MLERIHALDDFGAIGAFDQIGAHLEGLAGVLGQYYRKLRSEGLSKTQSYDLVLMYAEAWTRRTFGSSESE